MVERPNIILIMTDQQRAGLTAREGFPLDTMPFVDSMASQGVWFSRSYTSYPACAPARVSMLTGRYPNATHVRTNHNIADAYYETDLIDVLKKAGYRTALCGKNHSYLAPEMLDYWYHAGHLSADDDDENQMTRGFAAWMAETHFHLGLEPTPFPLEAQFPYRCVSHAQEYIDGCLDQDSSFFLWLSFAEPHNPYQVPEPYWSLFEPDDLPEMASDEAALETKGFSFGWCRERFEDAFPGFGGDVGRARANYYGMMRLIDDQIARLVAFLDARGVRDDTLIVFLSDHGDFVGEYGLMRKGPEVADVLCRIPFQITGPGVVADASAHSAHVSIADLMPTLCEAIGQPIPAGVQGRSLWPMLTGQPYPAKEFASVMVEHGYGGLLYGESEELDPRDDGMTPSPDGVAWGGYDCLNSWTQSGQTRMVRRGDWKLVMDSRGVGQLYNLVDDPVELDNRFGGEACVDIQSRLMADMVRWLLRVQDPLPPPRKRYVIKRANHNYMSMPETDNG